MSDKHEPFQLLTRGNGSAAASTLEDVAGKVDALAVSVGDLADKVDLRFDVFHEELSLLRHQTIGEGGLQQRVTSVEQKTLGAKAMTLAGHGIKWGGVLTLVLTVAVQIASTVRPDLVGPLQELIKLFGH
jgi:hypothetical protein